MRSFMILAVAFLYLQPFGQAQSEDEAKAIIGKAIKAMGQDKQSQDFKGFRTKAKGTLEIMGASIPFSQTVTIRLPNQFKDVMELDANGMKIPVITTFDGNKGWVEAGGKIIKLDDKINNELKEVAVLVSIGRLTTLLDKKFELAVIGEAKVEERAALGIRVSTKGAKDFNLFFDKKTSLLTKVERQALEPMSGKEVQEERIIRSYQDLGGFKIPHKLLVLRDGKKFLEAEVTEHMRLEKVDPGEFEMPK